MKGYLAIFCVTLMLLLNASAVQACFGEEACVNATHAGMRNDSCDIVVLDDPRGMFGKWSCDIDCVDEQCVDPGDPDTCEDPDGGLGYYNASTVTVVSNGIKMEMEDYCEAGSLIEMKCSQDGDTYSFSSDVHECLDGYCENGACVGAEGLDVCEENDGGNEPDVGGYLLINDQWKASDKCVAGESNILKEYFCNPDHTYDSVEVECEGSCKSQSGLVNGHPLGDACEENCTEEWICVSDPLREAYRSVDCRFSEVTECVDGQCSLGRCVVAECHSDSDCDDSDPLTEDICFNAGKDGLWKFCVNETLSECVDDNCSAENACESDADCDDSDASTSDSCEGAPKVCIHTPIICGDGRCEASESSGSCCTDCGCEDGFQCIEDACSPIEDNSSQESVNDTGPESGSKTMEQEIIESLEHHSDIQTYLQNGYTLSGAEVEQTEEGYSVEYVLSKGEEEYVLSGTADSSGNILTLDLPRESSMLPFIIAGLVCLIVIVLALVFLKRSQQKSVATQRGGSAELPAQKLQELYNYINSYRRQGYSDEQIRQGLLRSNYPPQTIDLLMKMK